MQTRLGASRYRPRITTAADVSRSFYKSINKIRIGENTPKQNTPPHSTMETYSTMVGDSW